MASSERRWVGPGIDAGGSLLQRVLAARPGLGNPQTPRERALLDRPGSLSLLHGSSTMPGATDVAVRLEAAVRAGRPVAIYGDYDADGMTATAVLWRTIKAASPDADVRTYVPDRLEEGYGLNEAALESLARDGVRTVVTVDCGASALVPSRRARALGLELLVTDHHDAEPANVAEADAIAHPSLPGRAPAPFTHVCGAAVALKVANEFARAWCGGDNVAQVLRTALAGCLPLVAIGTVADVVPLVDENRVLVSKGLDLMRSTTSVGLRALLEEACVGGRRRVDASDVGFRLGPRLNAVGRLGHAREAVELLVTSDEARAREIVLRLGELNERRKRMDAEVLEQACARIEADASLAAAGAIVLADARWHEGVVGIVAAKVAERYGRPAILLALRDDGTAKGSGRSVEGIDLLDTVRGAAGALMQRGGGHAYAMGLTLRAEDVPAFAERVSEACRAAGAGEASSPVCRYDAEAASEEFTRPAVEQLDVLRPYGRGNDAPTFLVRGARPQAPPTRFGRDREHLEFFLAGGARGIAWRATDADAALIRHGVPVDLLVQPSMDTYGGVPRVQVVVEAMRAPQPAGVR
jgi:single-stranded-DNA-specific exonuclease